jgi:hypothetical protein
MNSNKFNQFIEKGILSRWLAWPARTRQTWIAGILALSTVSALLGAAALFSFNQTAGAVSTVPSRWPISTHLVQPAHAGVLLVFVHPYCSCSVATIHEIANLSLSRNSRKGALSITVLFYRPKNSQWEPGSLWGKVEREIPGARAVWDDEGREAMRFGARTSGYTLLYGAGGDLLFKGGVTESRGHEGDNFGIGQLQSSLDTGLRASRTSLVFGCALAGADEPSAGVIP